MNLLKKNIEKYIFNSFEKIKINSKDIKRGDIFIALKGKNRHGNYYIKEANAKNAKYIITDKSFKSYKNVLIVENTFDFLKTIAIKKRNLFDGKVIAITGSIGKTSLKSLLSSYLSKESNISSSIKSYNNFLGVLVSILNLNLKSSFGIFEVGTNNFNEIKKLATLINPHQVIISNINPTHLENFINTRNIAKEKSDLFNPKFSPNVELLILPKSNTDEIYLNKLANNYSIDKIITFGKSKGCNYILKKIEKLKNDSSKVHLLVNNRRKSFFASTFIEHHITNFIIVSIIFSFNKLNLNKLYKNNNKILPIQGRGVMIKASINNKKIHIIDESYNASPTSVINCINYFENYSVNKDQRKILILGEMLELGKNALKFHQNIIMNTLNKNINLFIFCGSLYKKNLKKINKNMENILYFNNENQIYNFLYNNVLKNDIILLKGSNSSKVNILVKKFLKEGK